jgi:hypothetical protein
MQPNPFVAHSTHLPFVAAFGCTGNTQVTRGSFREGGAGASGQI